MLAYEQKALIQSRIDHYRGRVAATQGAIVALCDKPLDDKSAIIGLEGLCNIMVNYRERLNYWLNQEKVTGVTLTPENVERALGDHFIGYGDIYATKSGKVQIEKLGRVDYWLARLRELGFECEGEQDEMNGSPYSLIQISKIPSKVGV